MQYMGLNEIREKFLTFFESKGHLRAPSFPLVPLEDKSLLLINSGMAPLKQYFTGEVVPPSVRMTTCQKCIRTPDIERVGKTSRHGTFFEMLGNFSFGDYFKIDATAWAWEFITKVMEIPIDRLWVSVYLDDDEAMDIWTQKVGVDPSRMVRLGKADNFWEIGAGPCGPCSEIYFDRGAEHACDSPDCAVGCDCDRYVEFWNLVFTQFNNDGNNNYSPLEKKNIDTGMGLERLACIMQGVNSLFDVDTVRNITTHISKIAGKTYGESDEIDVSLRVITDHIRSTVMMVCDGVIPSNEGRGYVLRRLLRRAARHGKLLGIKGNFLCDVTDTVIAESKGAYPELAEKQDYIKKVIKIEEERFQSTIDSGLKILEDLIEAAIAEGKKDLAAADVFKLYDTFGFPIDLTLEILSEKGLTTDQDGFNELMKQQKENARRALEKAGDTGWASEDLGLDKAMSTKFVGYDKLEHESTVYAIICDGELRNNVQTSENVSIILHETPFYAESGGQVGDIGVITTEDGCVVKIFDTKKTADGKFISKGKVVSGVLSTGDTVCAKVDLPTRRATMRAHTTTHLLQQALRDVLGNHVEQAGSYVTPDTLRFDFVHFQGMTPEEIAETERRVNDAILEGYNVAISEMPIAEAKKLGAAALFGEKYGDIVRVVNAEGYSVELCGGTHLDNTSKAGSFKIISEASVAAGVRRIEAYTGKAVIDLLRKRQEKMDEIAQILKTTPKDLVIRASQMLEHSRDLERIVEKLTAKMANRDLVDLLNYSKAVKGIEVISAKLDDLSMDAMRMMGDTLRDQKPNVVAVLSTVAEGKINFLCVCGKDAIAQGANAGKIIKEVAKLTGGGGGGRPDSATAGGKDVNALEKALEEVNNIVDALV